ncbi:Tudor domain-containing protein 1 [Merluccius polli]|uniref:Tudor domain-containing protein 1 n=1 Tax=Merluccius polli TaxID=89951 RepID=A0AA47MIQ2_MERPO|nr:Tudor domain-containing protein 1 [Merluccius polli]
MTPNVLLIYKLLELENARKALDQGLRGFTNRASEEVQRFLDGSFPTHRYCELSNSLDAKCQTLNSLLTALQDVPRDPQSRVKASADHGDITNRLYLKPDKAVLTTDVLKFGPILQNVLLAGSITKAVQVLGATLSLRRLQHILGPRAVGGDVSRDGVEPSQNTDAGTTDPSSDFQMEENKECVMFKDKAQVSVKDEPPLMNQRQKDSREVPTTKPMSQKTSGRHSTNILMSTQRAFWEVEHDIPVPHQKQTSAQLLDFLRTNTDKRSATEATFTQLKSPSHLITGYPSATISPKIQQSGFDDCSSSSSSGGGGGGSSSSRDDARCVDASPPEEDVVAQYTDGRVPVFRVKRAESSEGTRIYSCMVLTKTELWDIGEVVKQETRGAAVRVATEKRQNEGESGYDKIPAGDPAETPQSPRCTNTTCGSVSAKTILLSRHTSIPKFEICAFKEMEVVVSHVVTPGNFYIQHPDVMAKQRALVKEWNGPLFAEENSVPDIGTLVMGFFSEQKQWCRAQVMKICGVSGGDEHCGGTGGGVTNISVEVMRLDHGDTACLSLRNVGYLTPDMAVLPLQAARVSLASVTPAEGSQWTEQAVSWFKAMVENRTLYARLYPLDSTITVQLFLEKGKMGAMRRGASVSLRLAQNGHAKHDKMKAVGGVKRGNYQLQMKKQEADWQKYLISCYTERK